MTDDATMLFFNQAIKAHQTFVQQDGMTTGEIVIAEKLHGILSLMIFDQTARMNRANKA